MLAGAGRGAQRDLDFAVRRRAGRSSPGSRGDPRRAGRGRRRHEPVDHSAARPAPTCTSCAPRSTRSWSASARSLADDPQLTVRDRSDGAAGRRRQPLRVVVGTRRPCPPGARVLDGSPPRPGRCRDRTTRDGGAARACTARASATCCSRAGRRWPARSCAPAWSTASSPTSRPRCSAPARRALGDAGIVHASPTRSACESVDVRLVGSDVRITRGSRTACRRADVHRDRRGARRGRRASTGIADDAARLTVRGPLVTADAAARRLDRRQRRLPDRGRRTDDGRSPPTSWPRRWTGPSLGALAPGQPVNLERPVTLPTRLGGHLVQGHVDGVGTIAARTPGRALGGGARRAAGGARPLRRREGLDHRRRGVAHRRRGRPATGSRSA